MSHDLWMIHRTWEESSMRQSRVGTGRNARDRGACAWRELRGWWAENWKCMLVSIKAWKCLDTHTLQTCRCMRTEYVQCRLVSPGERKLYAHGGAATLGRWPTRKLSGRISWAEQSDMWECWLTQTARIVKYVVLQQDGVQSVVGCPPALYGAYERKADESYAKRESGSVSVHHMLATYPARA